MLLCCELRMIARGNKHLLQIRSTHTGQSTHQHAHQRVEHSLLLLFSALRLCLILPSISHRPRQCASHLGRCFQIRIGRHAQRHAVEQDGEILQPAPTHGLHVGLNLSSPTCTFAHATHCICHCRPSSPSRSQRRSSRSHASSWDRAMSRSRVQNALVWSPIFKTTFTKGLCWDLTLFLIPTLETNMEAKP